MALYVCNANFGEYSYGEYVTAEPALVSDWIEAQYLSLVDDEGSRLVDGGIDLGAEPVEQPMVVAPSSPSG